MNEDNKIIAQAKNNFKFTLFAQIVVLILGMLKSIFIPKLLNVQSFGYWQVYLFYTSYVGLFALGFNDGIYLIYGKLSYRELPYKKIRTASHIFGLMLMMFTLIACFSTRFINNTDRRFAMFFVALNIIIVGFNGLFIYILQTTNQIKKYSFYSIIDKLLMMLIIFLLIFIKEDNYKIIIVSDLGSKIIVTLCLAFSCKELILGHGVGMKEGIREFTYDVEVGIKLMIANLMGMIVTGIGRFVIEIFGDISQYAYYSFGISITNLVLVMITSVSLVLYPTLRRLPERKYGTYFKKLNISIRLFNFIALISYFPCYLFIQCFLPKYNPMLSYLNILFVIVILQSKMQLLNNTFYKVLRREKAMLRANMTCVFMFSVLAIILFVITRSVWMIAFSTLLAMGFRCYASEIYLRNIMKIQNIKSIFREVLYAILFMLITSYFNIYLACILYLVQIIVYIFKNITLIKEIFLEVKSR